jgi:hypothetical protein
LFDSLSDDAELVGNRGAEGQSDTHHILEVAMGQVALGEHQLIANFQKGFLRIFPEITDVFDVVTRVLRIEDTGTQLLEAILPIQTPRDVASAACC